MSQFFIEIFNIFMNQILFFEKFYVGASKKLNKKFTS